MNYLKKIRWIFSNRHATNFDIEITNDCNTTCVFCPRDKVGQKGYITPENFIKAVQRFKESKRYSVVALCGLGEPLLHPNVVEFVKYLSDESINFHLTSNGKLLTEEMSHKLLEAGLKEIHISASGIGETYEKIHRIKFDLFEKNVSRFLEISDGKCLTLMAIVPCKENNNQVTNTKKFWSKKGIIAFTIFQQISRGGALDMNYYFIKSNRFYDEAKSILSKHRLIQQCLVPMIFGFLGWDGQYYLCCHDYSKKHPLGDVNDFSIEEIHMFIKERFSTFSLCRHCEFNPINIIREILFKVETGEMKVKDLNNKIAEMQKSQLC